MIHRIRIQNYKSLRDVTVDLSPVTVLIGKSGTGKTNFISAIRFLRDYLAGHQDELARQQSACKCATNPSGTMEFEIEFTVPELADAFHYAITFGEQVQAHPKSESLRYGARVVFAQGLVESGPGVHDLPQWSARPGLVNVPNPGPAALRRLPGLEEVAVAQAALTEGIGIYKFPYDVVSESSSVRQRPGAPGHDRGTSGLAEDAQNYLDVLASLFRDLREGIAVRKAIVAALKKINQSIENVAPDSLQNPQKAVVSHKFGDKILTLELPQESDGFRRFLMHLLAVSQKPSKQTLVFEEPENGIYPGALSLLADEFKAAPDSHRGQVLLTTHSPALLDHFSDDQIRVVELVDLETKIGPLAEEQREALREDLLHAGELLTVDPARRSEP